jgi:hypothetical protein
MKKTIASLILGLFIAALGGCKKPADDSTTASGNRAPAAASAAAPSAAAVTENRNGSAANGNTPPPPSPANANGNANASSGAAPTAVADPTKLVGTYALNQIQKEGVSTMMSVAKIEIVFNADGRYSRAASAKGKTIHTESGQFSIAGDSLTFKIVLSNKTILKPPVEKKYTIGLTPDGRELRLTSKTGDTAVFYRSH